MIAPEDTLSRIDISSPERCYHGPRARRDSTELWSAAMPLLAGRDVTVLDLGCGPRDQAVCAAHLGYGYVAVDYSGESADALADAQALPFRDATFDGLVLNRLANTFEENETCRNPNAPNFIER